MKLSRRHFLLTAALSAPSTWLYAAKIEPFWLDIVEQNLVLPNLAPEFDGYRLLQISDIHLGEAISLEWLLKIVDEVNRLQPDSVVITGDLVTGRARPQAEALKQAFRQIIPPTFAIAGNHDHWGWIPVFREVLRESHVTDLSNAIHSFQRGRAQLHLAGLDDVWMNRHDLPRIMQDLPPTGAAILLVHEPDYADTAAQVGRFDLQLSGHSHGGQVRIPLVGAPFLPYLGQKYPRGLYQIGRMWLYTNRGLGMVNPAFRLGNRPEITLFTLHAA